MTANAARPRGANPNCIVVKATTMKNSRTQKTKTGGPSRVGAWRTSTSQGGTWDLIKAGGLLASPKVTARS